MNRFQLIQVSPFLITLIAFSCWTSVGLLSADEPPNFIFILADDQGWNGTSVQMHPGLANSRSDYYQTPNLERLAQAGMRFSNAYAPGPMCSPSRASLQTGKSPAQLRYTNVGGSKGSDNSQRLQLPPHVNSLSTQEITIGEILGRAGYQTAWFGKWHLGRGQGPGAHGYDEHDGPTMNSDGDTGDPDNPKDIFGITDRGIEFMERNAKAGKPFYLQLWHYAVHAPVQSRESTAAATRSHSAGRLHRSAPYAAMTADLDAGVGMILDKLEELSIADNTYVIYMSDHGSGPRSSSAPLNGGKGTLWEGGLRVPLIISGPGIGQNKFCLEPTAGWDLFPTICELAGVRERLPNGIEGASLQPMLATGTGNLERSTPGLVFHFPHYRKEGTSRGGKPHSTILVENYKLMKLYESNQLLLFDLNDDIGEQHDLAGQLPKKARMMNQLLMDHLESIDAGIPVSNPDFEAGSTGQRREGRARRGRKSKRDR